MGTSRVLIRAFQATSAATHCGEATNAFFIQWKVQVHASIRNVEAKLQFREASKRFLGHNLTTRRRSKLPLKNAQVDTSSSPLFTLLSERY